MAKKRARRRKKEITIPLAAVAGFAPAAFVLSKATGNLEFFTLRASQIFTGFDPSKGDWKFERMMSGTLPVLAGFVVSNIATALGANRALRRAGIPFIRI